MSDSNTELLKRFASATGCTFVEAHYSGFPLNAKILDRTGKVIAVAEVTVRADKISAHSHFMQTIWRLEEGKDASAEHKVPYLILCKFADADRLYEYAPSHKFERRSGDGKSPREQRAISGSVFIPMTYFKKFEQWTVPEKKITEDGFEEVEF